MYDHITIRRYDDGTFLVKYTGEVKESDKANTGVANSFDIPDADGVMSYIDTCLTLIIKDQCPFATIDVLVPCFPSVKFFPSKLEDVRDCIQKTLRMWA